MAATFHNPDVAEVRVWPSLACLPGRLRGRPPAGDGWEAVATENDEPIEMAQSNIGR
ncbi:hypothetical protein C8R44DRAFT_802439 [Mycena epipterygia]|nr:hypothetical protein C8R44DRAFT_802439 [Mycena epipterygia]